MRFESLTAPEIEEIRRDQTVVVAPIAACEQHSDHLPVFTDSILVGAVAEGLEQERPDQVLLLPVLWIGASEHHVPFGGTLTATLPTYEQLLIELLLPMLRSGFQRILLLNGHGGNIDPLKVALRRLDVQFPKAVLTGAAYWELASEAIAELCRGPRKSVGHACEVETSMMMHLRPELVRTDRIADDPADLNLPDGLFQAIDFGRRTQRGAVGYPSFATPESGVKMLEAIVQAVTSVTDRLAAIPLQQT